MVATEEHRELVPLGHTDAAHAPSRAQRALAAVAYWGPVVVWVGLEIRWRWHQMKARLDLP
ncbi:MAG TPA: hypothetical protein VFC33_10270 [Acidimicrobiia bacterium]|nr:hypothetical protein [Acidimicrobiia bacterium]